MATKRNDVELTTLLFVTGNEQKLTEIKTVLAGRFNVTSKKIDLPEYQGEPDSVSIAKCAEAVKQVGGPLLIEDTCLCCNALGGLPGPYIKHFYEKLGSEGLHRLLTSWEDKSAYCMSTFAYHNGNHGDDIRLFKGILEGKIVFPRGPNKFGFDNCFQPKGYEKTYAEMTEDLQTRLSPRARALQSLSQYLLTKDI
ncbi:inosine triphosphate pyrophosphatase-like [Glandiceps talaboti]